MKTLFRFWVAVLAAGAPLAAAAQSAPAQAPPAGHALKPSALAAAPEPDTAAPAAAPDATQLAAAPLNVLTGTVLNELGQPLAGAVVTLASDSTQTSITNASGFYELRSAAAVPELHVSYAGYQDGVFTADAARPVTFQLERVADYSRQLKKQTKAAEKAIRKP